MTLFLVIGVCQGVNTAVIRVISTTDFKEVGCRRNQEIKKFDFLYRSD